MSIWKIIGGFSGFALGGPLGAIIGVAAGYAVDKARDANMANHSEGHLGAQQVAFTSAVIVLCAKMAKADGQVTPDEIAAFKKIFHIPSEELQSVGNLFNEAKQEASGFEPYAQQIRSLFANQPSVLEEILGALFVITNADGKVDSSELLFLNEVAVIFGFSEKQFERLKATYIHNYQEDADVDPYKILGITRDLSDDEVKKSYRKMVRDYHPDKLISHGVPKEFIDLANEKVATINAAYDRIEKERGFS